MPFQNGESPQALTPTEAAERLNLHVETVRRMLRDGELPAAKVGKRSWRIRAEVIDAILTGEPR
ncbi:helix-turn-helix domain-containing protein [Mycolicibacterium septicum]|uniref:helix-turn-helix domain-containing protein n=1 Tax=Mycolicibacterium septicum TaxID=98668 RepID=UPI003D3472EF